MDNNIMKLNNNGKSIKDKLNIDYYEITEKDFYPPEDKRFFRSGVEDIPYGDNFLDYINWFYENYEIDIFDV